MAAPSLEPARPATIRLAFALDPASVRAVSIAIRDFLSEQGVAERELYSYELCIAEAGSNAAEFAQGAARALKPVAEALFTPTQVELRVTDYTRGFALPENIPPPSPLEERGRGLFLIMSAMDEVRYLRGATENTLVMRKNRSPVQASPAERDPISNSPVPPGADPDPPARVFREGFGETGHGADGSGGFGGQLLADLLRLTSADWYVLRLLSPDGRQLAVAATSHPEMVLEPVFLRDAARAPRGIEAVAAANQTPGTFHLRKHRDPAEPLRAVGAWATGLVCPLCFKGTLVGTLAVGRRAGDFPPGKLQEGVVRSFAEFLAIQTINLRRQKEEVRHRVAERELEIAQEIQQLLMPRTLPKPPRFGLAGGWKCAREVGGDFYEAIAPDGRSLLLLIADVMGKGVLAALFATTMRGLFRGLADRIADPARILGGLNRLLFPELAPVNLFITAQIVHVDLGSRRITAAGAGHCPVLFMAPGKRAVSALHTKGLPIGVLSETTYRNSSATLGTPGALLLHTDGIANMRNAAGKAFSERRLKAWIGTHVIPGRSAAEVCGLLEAELDRFRDGAGMADDQAYLLLAEDRRGEPKTAARAMSRLRVLRGSFLFPPET